MRIPYIREIIEIPSEVKVEITDHRIIIKGPLGTLEKEFKNIPIVMHVQDGQVIVESYLARRRDKALVRTIASHIRNMILGTTRGWRYRLKIIYSHFPMNVKVEEDTLVIENFLGRKSKITVPIPRGVKVSVTKDDIIIEGIDKEIVSQFAANIEQATTLRGKERICPHGREGGPGVLDGIYVYVTEHMR
ncbi:MAG: 50S ribosomal protein L6 [Thermoprotei archaeon ex4572_64]|nr:MAG: 50S ribosomal protein L6 [Thermoprotei archaeon ex4572_64]